MSRCSIFQRRPLRLDGGAEVQLERQALPGQFPALVLAGAFVAVGQADLRDPVLVAQHHRDLVQIEAEQGLQLPDPSHPGQIIL